MCDPLFQGMAKHTPKSGAIWLQTLSDFCHNLTCADRSAFIKVRRFLIFVQ